MQTMQIAKADEKYRWRYEVSLFKNPTIFFQSVKAIAITILITMLFIFLLTGITDGFNEENFRFVGKLTLIIIAIFAVLLIIGYFVYAAVMGGAYIVDFEMDSTRLIHAQDAKQTKKAEKIGTAAVVMGVLTKTRGAVGAGLLAAARSVSITEFEKVKKVVLDKHRSVIKLRSIGWNAVYADGEDFDFVAEWIKGHVPETAELVVK